MEPISGRVERASAAETADGGSILSWAKPKTIKIGLRLLGAAGYAPGLLVAWTFRCQR